MAMKLHTQGSTGSSVDVDMTPMIDIVFQLITFFMVVINFEEAQTDERVKMAQSMLARPPVGVSEDKLVIQMGYFRDKEGTIQGSREEPIVFWNGEALRVEQMGAELANELRVYKRKNPGVEIPKTTIIIRADAECPTGKVQEMIRICQEYKYEKFSLKAESKLQDAI